jgi:hypothetical protein
MEFTLVVAARFPTKEVVARAVVKYRLVPSSMSEVVVEYQAARVRYEERSENCGRPKDEVATEMTLPCPLAYRRVFERFVIAKEVVVALVRVVLPVKVLLSASKVEEAAVIWMFAVPSKETPLMVRAFWRAVAVPAFPETEPVMVLETVRLVTFAVPAERLVLLAYVALMLVVEAFWKVCVPVKVLFAYVLGMVVEAAM